MTFVLILIKICQFILKVVSEFGCYLGAGGGVGYMQNLEEVYDATWRYGTLRTLHGWNLRVWLQLFVSDFLQHHHFCVCFGIVFSCINQQESGVPYICVLSVTLLTIVISGMVSAVGSSVSISVYVNVIAIYHNSQSIFTVEHHLQIAINHLSDWALRNWFTFTTAKIQCVHFTRVRGLHPPPRLLLSKITLTFAPAVKLLGLHFYSKLSLELHL
jgi:hypothetical protein